MLYVKQRTLHASANSGSQPAAASINLPRYQGGGREREQQRDDACSAGGLVGDSRGQLGRALFVCTYSQQTQSRGQGSVGARITMPQGRDAPPLSVFGGDGAVDVCRPGLFGVTQICPNEQEPAGSLGRANWALNPRNSANSQHSSIARYPPPWLLQNH